MASVTTGITNWLEIDDVVMPTPMGVKYSYSVFDSDNSKRSETGVLHREVIRKNVHSPTFTFKLQTADYRKLMNAIEPDVFKVKYLDPKSETGYTTIPEAYHRTKTGNSYSHFEAGFQLF